MGDVGGRRVLCWVIEAVGVGVAGGVEACRGRLGVHHADEAVLVAGHVDRQGAGRVVGAGDQHRLEQLVPRHVIAGLEAGLRLVTGDLQRRDGRGVLEWPGVEDQPGGHELHQAGHRAGLVGVEGGQGLARVAVDHHVGGGRDRREVAGRWDALGLGAADGVGHRRGHGGDAGDGQEGGGDQSAEEEGLPTASAPATKVSGAGLR